MTAIKQKTTAFLSRYFSCETVSYDKILALFLPLLAENAFATGFSLINSSMISSAGMSALSAVNLVDTYTTVIALFFQGIATGAGIVVAQYRGARNTQMQQRAANLSIVAVTAFALFLAVVSICFRNGVINLFFGGADEEVLEIARYYMLFSCISLPLYGFITAELGVLRGIGEGKIALVITMINSVVYVLGNVLFIVVLGLEIKGLLISITITRIVTSVACFVVKRKMHSTFAYRLKELFVMDFKLLKRIILFGFPVAFENLLFNGGRLVLQMILVPLGTNSIATYNIAYNIMAFSQIPNTAMSTTMFTVAGMCMGAGRPEDCKYIYRNVYKFNEVLYTVIAVIILALHTPITAAFHAEPDMYMDIFWCVLITMAAQIFFHTPSFMMANVMRAAGDVVFTTIISTASMWIFRVLGSYIFCFVFGWGIIGAYVAMSMDWMARAIIFPIRFRRGKWEKMKVI